MQTSLSLLPSLKSVKDGWDIIQALKNPTKRAIIEYILLVGTENVTELSIKFRQQHSQMSQSVSQLKKLGLLDSERLGKEIYYSVNEGELHRITALLNRINQLQ